MLSSFRTRFGIPGVISVIALVFAMLGGAYAATNSSGGKATASAKAKAGPRGPRGKAGPAGPAGPQGPAGANGKDGSNGSNGANGKDGAAGPTGPAGATGADGKSVEAEAAGLGECPEGGTKFKIGGVTKGKACNGEEGAQGPTGPTGSPWTAGGVLPSGKTETGAWSVADKGATPTGFPFPVAFATITFSIPLSAGLEAANTVVVEEGETPPSDCDNGEGAAPSPTNPEADPGKLCVFVASLLGESSSPVIKATKFTEAGVSPSGGFILFINPEASGVVGSGSFAVTAP